jgi:hypothetical protein
MKIKAIALGATFALTALLASAADPVYSVNVVGYHKRTIPSGFSMFANQVDGTNNTVEALFPSPDVGTKVYKFNGTGFDIAERLGPPSFPFAFWQNGALTLNPGEGAFIFNPSGTITNIFAGEVLTGSITNPLPAGFSIKSSKLPEAGSIGTQLGLPTAVGDKVYKYNVGTGQYDTFELLGPPAFPFSFWGPSEPNVAVGDSFWVFKGASADWVRQFSVQ